jgi:hypothetical protein
VSEAGAKVLSEAHAAGQVKTDKHLYHAIAHAHKLMAGGMAEETAYREGVKKHGEATQDLDPGAESGMGAKGALGGKRVMWQGKPHGRTAEEEQDIASKVLGSVKDGTIAQRQQFLKKLDDQLGPDGFEIHPDGKVPYLRRSVNLAGSMQLPYLISRKTATELRNKIAEGLPKAFQGQGVAELEQVLKEAPAH